MTETTHEALVRQTAAAEALLAYFQGQRADLQADIATAQEAYAALGANLAGIIPTENTANGVVFGGAGSVGAKTEAKFFSVSTDWTDIITVGTRGGFKITLVGSESSDGVAGQHISEHWAIASNTLLTVRPAIVEYDHVTYGFDTQWVGSLFQVRARDLVSTQIAVKAEAISQYVNTTAQFVWS